MHGDRHGAVQPGDEPLRAVLFGERLRDIRHVVVLLEGDTCDQKSTSSKGDVDTCKADIDAMDCNFVVNATLPPSCQGLLHP